MKRVWYSSPVSSAIERIGEGHLRHAAASSPYDMALEREATARMNNLDDRIAERLEHDFRQFTEIDQAHQKTLGTIASWLGVAVDSEPADREFDVDEAHEVWASAATMASVELLRTASALASKRSPSVPASDFIQLAEFEMLGSQHETFTIHANDLAEQTWNRFDRDSFVHITGMGVDKSHMALMLAASETVRWAAEVPVVLPQDDVYLVVAAHGDDLQAVVMHDRPGPFLSTTYGDDMVGEVLVKTWVGSMRDEDKYSVLITTPNVDKVASPEFSVYAYSDRSTVVPSKVRKDVRILGVDALGFASQATLVCLGSGWIVGAPRHS